MAIRSKNRVSTNFNMSSMTDIVFLLLVFFIIASTLISPNAVEVLLPKASPELRPQPQTVNIVISEDLRYYVNEQEVSKEGLEQLLLTNIEGEDNPGIILRSDKSVPLENVVIVFDIANRNKLKLVIATSPN